MGLLSEKKENCKRLHILTRKEMHQFYHKISKINENFKKKFISPVTSTSYFDVALDKRNAGRGSLFCVWLFSCNDSMFLVVRKRFLRLNVSYQPGSNV